MSRDRFIGTWNLVSSEAKTQEGKAFRPYGDNPIGTITYDRAGRMSVHLMNRNRAQFQMGDKAGCTPAEAKDAIRTYDAYFGTYSIDEERRLVIHHVVGSLLPNWTGADLPRSYEFSGNRLILTSAPMDYAGAKIVGTVTWERAED